MRFKVTLSEEFDIKRVKQGDGLSPMLLNIVPDNYQLMESKNYEMGISKTHTGDKKDNTE